ncbi:MAG: TonB-dependent receptor plug domain-containing protein, partial [Gammaproteobacteria bacterium]|nr:TonB-dependent receptor plug domain-containing protein [Gammaproteobacteria bacterium]
MTHLVLRKSHNFVLKTLTAAVSMALLSSAGNVLAQQEPTVEEVIVTGSFIRRSEGISAASPVQQISAQDLENQGTVNMAQVIQNMTFNNGTGTTNSIQGTTSDIARFDLRGLGPSATLQLIDGKRVVSDNVQRMMPTIAIQRIDIVTDGAAALYGTDAVAGVINMVPYTSYDGFRVDYYEERDSRSDFTDIQTSFIGGRTFGDVDFVVAGSYRDGGTLAWHERPEYVRSGLTHNTGGNPGNFEVPGRDELGNLTGAFSNKGDPNCGLQVDPQEQFGGNPYGTSFAGRCWLSFGDTRDFKEAMDTTSLYGNLSWDVNDDLSLSAQVLYSRQIVQGRANPSNPGARVSELPVVRGELPGNTFRAKSGDGRLLFAQPLRDGSGSIVTDGFGKPIALRGSNGNVLLANNQFASMTDDPLGGIAFSEDVRLGAWTPFGKVNTNPTRFQNGFLNGEDDDKRTMRLAFTADFTVPYLEGWEGTSYYT